jgi:hypothetical protein
VTSDNNNNNNENNNNNNNNTLINLSITGDRNVIKQETKKILNIKTL